MRLAGKLLHNHFHPVARTIQEFIFGFDYGYSMSTLETPTEPNPKRQRVGLSKILTEAQFIELAPDFAINEVTDLQVPNVLSEIDTNEIVTAIGVHLVACAKSVLVDSEASKYPFLYEILKTLVRLADDLHVSVTKKTFEHMAEDEKEELAEQFDQISDPLMNESISELVMRWERYFSTFGGAMGVGFGYVEFSVEQRRNATVRLLIECKATLNRQGELRTATGYWQSMGAAVTAQRENIKLAGEQAKTRAITAEKARLAADPIPAETLRSAGKRRNSQTAENEADIQKAERLAGIGEEARVAAEQLAEQVPVFVALTDVKEWIFIMLQGKKIMVSKPIAMFDFDHSNLTAKPGMRSGLQFLCQAIGVSSDNIAGRLKSVQDENIKLSKRLIDGAYEEQRLVAREQVQTMQELGAEYDKARTLFADRFPYFDFNEFASADKW